MQGKSFVLDVEKPDSNDYPLIVHGGNGFFYVVAPCDVGEEV